MNQVTATRPAKTVSAIEQAKSLLDEILDNTKANDRTILVRDALASRVERIDEVLPTCFKGQGLRLAKRALMYFNSKGAECPPDQFIRCVVQAAELGLGIDGRLCHVVPFNEKGKTVYKLMVDYKGLIAVARRTGTIADVEAEVIYENDSYECKRGNGITTYEYQRELGGERGKRIGAFAVLHLPSGGYHFTEMDMSELNKVRSVSKAKFGPWGEWEDEMYKKTAIRRALKYFEDDPGIALALELLDDVEPPQEQGGETQAKERVESVRRRVRESAAVPEKEPEHEHPTSDEPHSEMPEAPATPPVAEPAKAPAKGKQQKKEGSPDEAVLSKIVREFGRLKLSDTRVEELLDQRGCKSLGNLTKAQAEEFLAILMDDPGSN